MEQTSLREGAEVVSRLLQLSLSWRPIAATPQLSKTFRVYASPMRYARTIPRRGPAPGTGLAAIMVSRRPGKSSGLQLLEVST